MSLSTKRPSKRKSIKNIEAIDNPKRTVRVNFNLDEEKYIELKKYALNNRKTITQLLTELIDESIIDR